MGKFIEKTLSNGLKVYFYQDSEIRSIETNLYVKVGRAFETTEESGISHFTEHIMFAGTEKYPQKEEASTRIKTLGGYINGRTSYGYSNFPIKVREEDFEVALDVLYQQTQKALISEEAIGEEKGIVIEEIRKLLDQPRGYLSLKLLPKVTFDYECMLQSPAGNEQSVQGFNRGQVARWYSNAYTANNMALSVVTRKKPEELIALIEKYFGNISTGEELKVNLNKIPIKDRVIFEKKPLKQVMVGFGFQIPGYLEEDPMPYHFLARVLFYRFFDRIRLEKQLAYDPAAGCESMSFTGRVTGIIPVNKDKLIEAVKTILEILEEVKNEVQELAFLKTRNTTITGHVFRQENASRLASSIIPKTIFTGEIELPEHRIEIAEKVTKEDIKKIAQKYLDPEHLGWAFLGDIDEKTEKEIRKLLS